jgi:hypothetical protein
MKKKTINKLNAIIPFVGIGFCMLIALGIMVIFSTICCFALVIIWVIINLFPMVRKNT